MENEKDIAIKIEGLKKKYRLGTIGGGTLVGDLQSFWARKRGKQDPNLKIGEKAYEKNETFMALDGIDLTIYKGERIGIIGHNGAGKSTLLKILSRVTGPTEGAVYIDGRMSSMLEVGTGFNRELTGRENIYLNGAILGMTRAEVNSKIEQIIDFSECRQFIDTPVKRYSSGMYVKLAFAVAAHLDSEILIMDEILAVGDMAFQKKCLDKMNDVSRTEGRTILYVSHNMSTIRQLCYRCVVMEHGKIIFDGDVENAISIYSGNSGFENLVSYDFTKTPRPHKRLGEGVFITDFTFAGKDKAVFERRENMRFSVGIDAKKSINDLKLLFVIKSSDIKVGVSQTLKAFASVTEGKHYSFEFEFDISNLAPGRYFFTPNIVACDNLGRYMIYDHPVCDIYFTVIDKHPEGISLIASRHGNVMLNPIKYIEK